ncbi:HAMP domain-containing sensor histidine kinase [Bdellovibrionota bacterium FG-2]
MSSGKSRGLQFRLTVLFVAIFGVLLVLFCTLLYVEFSRTQQAEFDAALFNHAVDMSQTIEVDFFGRLSIHSDQLAEEGKVFPFALGKAYLQISDQNGEILMRSSSLGSRQLPFSKEDQALLFGQRVTFKTFEPGDRLPSYRLISYLVERQPGVRLILQIGVPLNLLDRQKRGLLAFFLITIPLILVLAIFGGLLFSRRALDPVRAIIEKAKEMSPSQLSERVPVPVEKDELRELALTLNHLLDRLQQSFESQERFIADASHQLKTPLAILRGELDVLKRRPRTVEETSGFLVSASQEVEYLSKMVEDLLVLARVDAGFGTLSIKKVRVDELALEAVSRLERFAQTRKVKIRFNLGGSGSFEILGDSDLLQVMLRNLLENAIKFSPEDSCVEVEVNDEPAFVSVRVSDRGPGIPLEARERIFSRFFRAENTRNSVAGVGLGLPIAKRIIEIHQGTIEVSDAHPGASFTVKIKKN